MSEVAVTADLFGAHAVGSSRTRFALDGVIVRSLAGGRVGAGKVAGTKDATPLLVHTDIPSRQEQSIDLGAVASAVTGGVIPYPLLVAAFAASGTLEDLKKAIAAHK